MELIYSTDCTGSPDEVHRVDCSLAVSQYKIVVFCHVILCAVSIDKPIFDSRQRRIRAAAYSIQMLFDFIAQFPLQ